MKKFRLTKDTLARMCAAAGMQEAVRTSYKHWDVFIADGYTDRPGVVLKKFGVGPEEYPFGAYVTLWAIAKGEDHIELASILTEDSFRGHGAAARDERIATAIRKAAEFLVRREKISKSGIHLNA